MVRVRGCGEWRGGGGCGQVGRGGEVRRVEEGQLQGWLLQSWPPANITRLQRMARSLFTGVNRGKIPFFLHQI